MRRPQLEAEDRLEPGAMHPAGRSRVPRPTAAPDMRLGRVDVGGDAVGLYLVALHLVGGAGVVDRVEEMEQGVGAVAIAQPREGEHRPQGAMGVLTAILANAGRIALDVSRIERRPVEGWREEQCQGVAPADELLIDRVHGADLAARIAGSRDDAPGLGDRIDPARAVRRRPGRRSTVEAAAFVPFAIPAIALER